MQAFRFRRWSKCSLLKFRWRFYGKLQSGCREGGRRFIHCRRARHWASRGICRVRQSDYHRHHRINDHRVFATPAYNAALALRLLRFPLIILAGIFGLYGVMVGIILIANHLLSLKSFGVPYLSPFVPGNFQGMRDLLTRGPLWKMKNRPSFLHPLNTTRLGDQMKEQVDHSSTNIMNPVQPNDEKGR